MQAETKFDCAQVPAHISGNLAVRRRMARRIAGTKTIELMGSGSLTAADIGNSVALQFESSADSESMGMMLNPVDSDGICRRVFAFGLTYQVENEFELTNLAFNAADLFKTSTGGYKQQSVSIHGIYFCAPFATVVINLGAEQENTMQLRKTERRFLDLVHEREFDRCVFSPGYRTTFVRSNSGINTYIPLISRDMGRQHRSQLVEPRYIFHKGSLSNLAVIERATASYFDSWTTEQLRSVVDETLVRNRLSESRPDGGSPPSHLPEGIDLARMGVEI